METRAKPKPVLLESDAEATVTAGNAIVQNDEAAVSLTTAEHAGLRLNDVDCLLLRRIQSTASNRAAGPCPLLMHTFSSP
ncbi:hypothetical protein GCM10017710_27540 [Arthrobacter ramosus]